MKFYKRLFSLSLCFVLLFPVFSTIANAEEIEVKPYHILQLNKLTNNVGAEVQTGALTFTPNNDTVEKKENVISGNGNITAFTLKYDSSHLSAYQIGYIDQSTILYKDKPYTVRLNNFYHSALVTYGATQFYVRNINDVSVMLQYTDNILVETTDYKITHINGTPEFNIEFNITPSKDVKYILIGVESDLHPNIPSGAFDQNGHVTVTSYFGEINGDNKYTFTMEVESQETGLLKSVIQWLSSIKDKISETFSSVTDGFSNMSQGFTNIISNIVELPSKLWNAISNGLKELFVPNENQLTEYKENWDMLLSQKFGAIYEVGEIISDYASNIKDVVGSSGSKTTVNMPSVSLDSIGIPFSFGGYEVNIVPNGFEYIINICKKILSIVCTFLFVNGLRKRYDEIMGGNTV